MTITTRQRQCRSSLEARGFSVSGASALVGNFSQESGPSLPSAFRRSGLDHGSNGLPQWRLERLTNYQNFVKQRYPNHADLWAEYGNMEVQLDFVVHELETDYPKLCAKLRAGGDVAALTADVCWQYERPNRALSGIEKRIQWALDVAAVNTLPAKDKGLSTMTLKPLGVVDHLQTAAAAHQKEATGGVFAAIAAAAGAGGVVLTRPADGLPWWAYVTLALIVVVIATALSVAASAAQHARNLRQAIGNVTPDAPPADEVQHGAIAAPPDPEVDARVAAEVERRVRELVAKMQPAEVQPSDPLAPQNAGRAWVQEAKATAAAPASGSADMKGSDATLSIGRA